MPDNTFSSHAAGMSLKIAVVSKTPQLEEYTVVQSANLDTPHGCMNQARPTTASIKSDDVVEIGFNKIGAEGVHIYGMRDGGAGFAPLASETHSPYVDNRPLLTAGKPETRQYKAVFFLGKSEIGLPSDVARATAKP